MKLIDTHCHYNLEPLYSGWLTHWQNAQRVGVLQSIIIGTTLESSQQAVTIAEQDKNLFAAVGLHPAEVSELLPDPGSTAVSGAILTTAVAAVQQLVQENRSQVVAIGEIGLDYFHYQRTYANPSEWLHLKDAQQQLCTAQLHLAREVELPVVLHVRSADDTAYWDILQILKQLKPKQPIVLHCASGPLTYISDALELGAYISVAGNVTYKNADAIRAIVTVTPADRLLLETDAPYLPPTPHRGKTCEPAMIQLTAAYLEQELRVDLAQVLANTQKVFSL